MRSADVRVFHDRRSAGRELAALVSELALDDPVVLGLPRGGVPVAYEVAHALGAPLDVLVARKIGAPGNPELAMGAVAEGGVRVFDHALMGRLLVSPEELDHSIARAEAELAERVARYRGEAGGVPIAGRSVVVVDDGLATGATARAALRTVRALGAGRVILAVPIGPEETIASIRAEADEVVCVEALAEMWAIGMWYEHFGQTSDEEVAELLARARNERAGAEPAAAVAAAADPGARPLVREAHVPLEDVADRLRGDLVVPASSSGLVVFAHGSGSSRHSPRNRHVAESLHASGFATLLMDLLTVEEELDRRKVFDIPLLGERLLAAMAWAREQPELHGLRTGLFGASTGAAAALWAAADAPDDVAAIVSRGGRPDLALRRLEQVTAPVLLIVGGRDLTVLDLNRLALEHLPAGAELSVVEGATHLFEEPGALDEVSRLAGGWFERHLGRGRAAV